MILESGPVNHILSGWVDPIETITCPEILKDSSWNYFKEELDLNTFFGFPETIGCPDCADGGAEWIEIELNDGEKHKVTFEFHDEPSELENYVTRLREMKENVQQCEENLSKLAPALYSIVFHNL